MAEMNERRSRVTREAFVGWGDNVPVKDSKRLGQKSIWCSIRDVLEWRCLPQDTHCTNRATTARSHHPAEFLGTVLRGQRGSSTNMCGSAKIRSLHVLVRASKLTHVPLGATRTLARSGSLLPSVYPFSASNAYVSNLNNQRLLKDWQLRWANDPPQNRPIEYSICNVNPPLLRLSKLFKSLSRKSFSGLVQCRTGHAFIGQYYERFVPDESATCCCGGASKHEPTSSKTVPCTTTGDPTPGLRRPNLTSLEPTRDLNALQSSSTSVELLFPIMDVEHTGLNDLSYPVASVKTIGFIG
ncbi:hypothetical protein BS47DRAFT_1487704 [Hydnum rufescens UP504]|uniref:Uncharacterized protein n=1 Tax=Hydnum rufescens UP504 TaxID=1448309 RepID=A0A9P6DSV0_9AGAM|nr:hypothetical protein BS47DRAFT_1487704 [Hydnum rufescens UP504]